MLKPSEFKSWMDRCIRDARERGLSETDIICELIDQLKRLLVGIEVKVICGKRR
jgi:hypothetical protein